MKPLILCAVLPFTLLAGCSSVSDYVPTILTPYRPDIHQGNVVTSEMVENLHEGMTKNQVIFLLGTATLQSIFHKNEWSYVYYLNPRGGQPTIRKLTIVFNDDNRVESFKSDPMPDETDADLAILGERAREETLKRRNDFVAEKKNLEAEEGAAAKAQSSEEAVKTE